MMILLENWESSRTKFSQCLHFETGLIYISGTLTCSINGIAETTREKIVKVRSSLVHLPWAPVLHLHFQYPVKDSLGSSCSLWTNSSD